MDSRLAPRPLLRYGRVTRYFAGLTRLHYRASPRTSASPPIRPPRPIALAWRVPLRARSHPLWTSHLARRTRHSALALTRHLPSALGTMKLPMPRTLAAIVVFCLVAPLVAQTPQAEWKGENLQHFPKDISRARLTQRMREFSFALNVRCQYCHAGGDGVSFEGVSFASDEKPAKVKARAMLRMLDQINGTILPQLASRATPRVDVDCATCHRGLALPKSLQTTLLETIEKDGTAAAVSQYRSLRQGTMTLRPLQLRRVGDERAGPTADRSRQDRRGDRDARAERRVQPEITADRLPDRRPPSRAGRARQGRREVSCRARQGAGSPAGQAAARGARKDGSERSPAGNGVQPAPMRRLVLQRADGVGRLDRPGRLFSQSARR